MITNIYYTIAIIVYSIFLGQFILSLLGFIDFDTDFDIDGDGNVDFSWEDIISFKGLLHFLMGTMGWLSIRSLTAGVILWYDYLIALLIGILFFFILFWLYKLMMKLENKPKTLIGEDLIGHKATVYYFVSDQRVPWIDYVILVNNGISTIQVHAESKEKHSTGDKVIITGYQNGLYKF